MRRSGAMHALVACALLLVGCSAGEPRRTGEPALATTLPSIEEPAARFPGSQWEHAESGDWSDLDRTLAGDGTTCVAVVKDGRLVHEAYFNGGSPDGQVRVYSITKSLTALLVGMRSDDGDLDLDGLVADHVPAWAAGQAAHITVRHLLAMTSGRAWSEQTDRTLIRSAADQTGYAVGLPQRSAPGEEWVYDNAAVQVLQPVLGDVVALASERLFGPLGMRHTRWPTDRAGRATTYSGVTSTCRDLARVGWLVLNQGHWRDDQLVSPAYVAQMTGPSSTRNVAYGLLWWTNARGRVVEVLRQAGFPTDKPPYEGRLAPGVPGDATWAFGYGNQYVAVVPSEGVVAVRLGRRPATADRVTFDSFTTAVLAGVEES